MLVTLSCGGPQEKSEPEPVQRSVTSHPKVELRWESNWDAAFARARTESKPVMANFYAEWCVWCKHLETITFRDQKVAALLAESVVPLNIDIDRDVKGLLRDYGIQAPPMIVLFTPDGEELGRIPGYLPPTNFMTVMEKILNGEPVQLN